MFLKKAFQGIVTPISKNLRNIQRYLGSLGRGSELTVSDISVREEQMMRNMPKHHMVFDPDTNKMAHATYIPQEIEDVKYIHYTPKSFGDRLARMMMSGARQSFDLATGYSETSMNEIKWYRRVIFLETVAGVPGFVGGMCRHLRSLRTLKRDGGWINQLLGEAENERQHLTTFMELRKPGPLFRLAILVSQGVFMNAYFVGYILSPKICHRFVGYLEEQAVKTYTHFVHDIDHGNMNSWGRRPASDEAKRYWGLPEGATLRDVVLAIRADEAIHRDFNHYLADIPKDSKISHEHIDIYNKRFRSAEGKANTQ